jgi:hypothetical protein
MLMASKQLPSSCPPAGTCRKAHATTGNLPATQPSPPPPLVHVTFGFDHTPIGRMIAALEAVDAAGGA